jgi:hypothetical protein
MKKQANLSTVAKLPLGKLNEARSVITGLHRIGHFNKC